MQEYIKEHASIKEDADRGKMFGVLIVEPQYNPQQDETSLNAHRSSLNLNTFFLAAYSGLLAGRNDWSWFVPPVVDAQQPDGVFKTREAEISAIN